MRTSPCRFRVPFPVWLALLVGLLPLRAERVSMSKSELESHATHIVVGQVTTIYRRLGPVRQGFQDTGYVAEVRVGKAEKGTGLTEGELIYVRYFTRAWVGEGDPPPDTAGYRELPKEGERLRVYVTRSGYNGFGYTKDGGFTVVGPNGFDRENLPAPAAK
jgi:hypothetical protein